MPDVFIMREMPDFERLKPYPENARYRQWFYSRWGHENAVVCGTARNLEYLPWRQRLSIKVARGGRERYFIDGRSIAVDDDSYLILNDNRIYASRFDADVEIESFSIFFRPGLAEEVHGALSMTIEGALASGAAEAPRAVEFAEVLHPHDSLITPIVRYVQHAVAAGVEDGDWYEEQYQFLLERMFAHQRRLSERVRRLPALKAATQKEIHRRLGLAVDLVHAAYERDIGLAEMATAACLSKFHFLRLFTELHGITPHAFLQRKRARVASRLLGGGLTATQVAERTGFRSRSTMARQLRRWNPAPSAGAAPESPDSGS
jgi:AraC family transcriptional regulator